MSPDKAPTMIIPAGTDIQVDAHGQLIVRTPGNLVIQHSGNFASLESVHGSIRIEAEAEVEAVTVSCAETCFVEGSLTAWKVQAQSVHLEESATANIVLQETESLQVGQGARLVGNFRNENELFYLFSRFASELRALPLFAERRKMAAAGEVEEEPFPQYLLAESEPMEAEGGAEPAPHDDDVQTAGEPQRSDNGGLPDPLFFSLVILEREFTRPAYGPTSQRAIEEIVKLLRDRDFETLRLTYRTLFGRIVEPGKDVQRVYDLIDQHFK